MLIARRSEVHLAFGTTPMDDARAPLINYGREAMRIPLSGGPMSPIGQDRKFEQDMNRLIATADDDPMMRLELEVFRDMTMGIRAAQERGRLLGLDHEEMGKRVIAGAVRAVARIYIGESNELAKQEIEQEADRFVRRLQWIKTRRRV